MKKNILFFTILISIITPSCNSDQKKKTSFSTNDIAMNEYASYGGEVSTNEIYYTDAITDQYKDMKEGDTLDIAFTAKINAVCKAKGCWMKLKMQNNEETMVKFKDYGFFVPTDTGKDSVIVQGRAYVSETSVEELRHLASDAGQSEKEIAAITMPKKTYSFMADGVLIKK